MDFTVHKGGVFKLVFVTGVVLIWESIAICY